MLLSGHKVIWEQRKSVEKVDLCLHFYSANKKAVFLPFSYLTFCQSNAFLVVRWMRIELTPCYRLAPETSASTVPPPAHVGQYTLNYLKSRI